MVLDKARDMTPTESIVHERDRLSQTFRDMVRATKAANDGLGGGSCVCRIPAPDAPKQTAACIIYVEGVTAEFAARAVENVQKTFERQIWWAGVKGRIRNFYRRMIFEE